MSAPESSFNYLNNRLITYNGQGVSFDADGNMTSALMGDGRVQFGYDFANRLISAGEVDYTYNAENTRIRTWTAAYDTTYTYNTNCALSQLLTKTTNGFETKYVYGLGLIGEEKGENFKTYHFDYRGSTVALTDIDGEITDTFKYDAYGKLTDRTGTSYVIFRYNGRDGAVSDRNGLVYMRARYYSPEHKRFVNADILHGGITDSTSLNRYAYVNGNPVSFVDPLGLSRDDDRGKTKYDRDAAIRYAEKYYKTHNSEYMNFGDDFSRLTYSLAYFVKAGNGDCANFVSQCLKAGGLQESEKWYFYKHENKLLPALLQPNLPLAFYSDCQGKLTLNPVEYHFSTSWTTVSSQYNYFSDPENGYINGEVIDIESPEDVDDIVSEYNIQKGDLLYWLNATDDEGKKIVGHSTIITKVTDDNIFFGGHSTPSFDKSLTQTMLDSGDSVKIVRLKDYF